MKKDLLKKIENQKGFTLVETLVAVAILVIGTLGPITIAAQGIASAGYAKDQITAYYLAQEGIEYVRNVRDGNALQGAYWLDHLDDCLAPAGVNGHDSGCFIAAGEAAQKEEIVNPQACQKEDACPLIVSSNDKETLGYYGYDFKDYTNTTYTRTIRIFPVDAAEDQINPPEEMAVQVDVTWRSRGNARSFSLKENIYNSN